MTTSTDGTGLEAHSIEAHTIEEARTVHSAERGAAAMSRDGEQLRAENDRLRAELARARMEALEHLRTKREYAKLLERALESLIDEDAWRARAKAAETARDRAQLLLSHVLGAHDGEHESASARVDAVARAIEAARAGSRTT